ncbi:MAG: PQQ-binding-like beta-propeller repeat protein, partial [Candidatus Latescibacterota bacterium]
MIKSCFIKTIEFSILLLLSFNGTLFAQLADSPWPMRGQNLQHTGRGTSLYSASNVVKWKYQTDWAILSSPAINTDGTVYIGSNDNYLYAINYDGTLKWRYQTGNFVYSTPAIGADGTVYVGSSDKYLYALKSDGTLKWKYLTGNYIYSSPAIGADGTVYVGSSDKYLYALKSDGILKWKYLTGSYIYSSPAIGADGTVYVGSSDKYLYAIKSDGTLKWKYQTSDEIVNSSPAIGIDGTVYVGNNGYYICAIKSDGTLKWKYPTGAGIRSSPAIGPDGTVYVGSLDYYLYAIKSDGTLRWKYKTNGGVDSSPAIGSDGTVYIGSWDKYLYAIKSDGTLKWKYLTTKGIELSSPAIGADGTVYIGSDDHYLYAFAPEGEHVVRVSSPDGGQYWIAGESHTISWESLNINNVKIEYTTDNGMNWTTITESTPAATGSYTWKIPNIFSAQCLVRISDASDATVKDVSNDLFTIDVSHVIVTSPNGEESWIAGENYNILWTSIGTTNVKLEYTTDNGMNWTIITESTPAATGSFTWKVPNIPSAQCLVRISDTFMSSINDASNNVFTIEKPHITISSPNGGENLIAGRNRNITWTFVGDIINIKLEYTTDSGINWTTITDSTSVTTGSYTWLVPNSPTAHCLIRISNASDPTVNDVSNEKFTILGPETTTLHVPELYPSIQEGIDAAAAGDTVLVAPGTYHENINFKGKKNIVVGSYYITTGDTSYVEKTIIDANKNGRVVEFSSGEDSTTVLEGFVITNGYFESGEVYPSYPMKGAGIFCLNSSPRL